MVQVMLLCAEVDSNGFVEGSRTTEGTTYRYDSLALKVMRQLEEGTNPSYIDDALNRRKEAALLSPV